jgi:integrase
MLLRDLAAEYAALTHPTIATVKLHEVALRQFARSLLKVQPEIADLTEENIARHVSRRMRLGKAPATIQGEQHKLLALWRFAARQGYLPQWPTVPAVKVPARVPRAWTQSELALVFKSFEHAKPMGACPGPLWWRSLFYVLWDSAERISAVLAAQWPHIDLDGQSLYAPAENRKGGHGDRLYPLADDTVAELRVLHSFTYNTRPFFHPCHKDTLYNRLKRMLLLAGLPADRQSKFHRMRRSVASHYEAAGGNATELLGHTSRKVTRVYLDPRICKPASAIDRLFRPHK